MLTLTDKIQLQYMNYIQFFAMRPEVSLLCIYLVIFLYDLISTGHYRRMFHPLVCISTLLLVILTLSDRSEFTLFGGMYESNAMIVFMKAIPSNVLNSST